MKVSSFIIKAGLCMLCCCFLTLTLSAQSRWERRGDRYMQQQYYDKAHRFYEKALRKGESPTAQWKLGEIYYQQDNFDQAIEEFNRAASNRDKPAVPDSLLLHYGYVLQHFVEYNQAKHWFLKYEDRSGDQLGAKLAAKCDSIIRAAQEASAGTVGEEESERNDEEAIPSLNRDGFDLIFDPEEAKELLKVENELELIMNRGKYIDTSKVIIIPAEEVKTQSGKGIPRTIPEDLSWGHWMDKQGNLIVTDERMFLMNKERRGLVYKVQIGAYKHNIIDADQFFGMPNVLSYSMNDGITRYVLPNSYSTIQSAEDYRLKAVEKGIKEAFIVPFYFGDRITMEQALQMLAQ